MILFRLVSLTLILGSLIAGTTAQARTTIECKNRPNFFITSFSPRTKTAFGQFRCSFPEEVSKKFGITLLEIVGKGNEVVVAYRSDNSFKTPEGSPIPRLEGTIYRQGESVRHELGYDYVFKLPNEFDSPYSLEARIFLLVKEVLFQGFSLYDLADNAEEFYKEFLEMIMR